MVTIIYVLLVLTLCYTLLVAVYFIGWLKQHDFFIPATFSPNTFISVIIPARNESLNIGSCIDSILAQHYQQSLFEIIVVDDYSEDNTVEIVNSYAQKNIRCIELKSFLREQKINSYKKAALELGIKHSRGELIVTIDADCTVNETWLLNFAATYEQNQPVMIVAPVKYKSTPPLSVLSIFQQIDFTGMQGITTATQFFKLGNMCNGANLGFSKKAFYEVNGYEGYTNLATGDDYLLMVKLARKFKGKITYIKAKQAIVTTLPQPDWQSFLNQRIRWASKSGKYGDFKLNIILSFVYTYNLFLLFGFVSAFFINYCPELCFILVFVYFLKCAVEMIFIHSVSKFFNNTEIVWFIPLLQPLHVLYIVVAGLLGFAGGYKWKGRKVR